MFNTMKCFFHVLTIWLFLIGNAYSQSEVQSIGPLSSPYHTVETHLGNLQEGHYYPERAAQAFEQSAITEKEAVRLAKQLKQLWDGSGTHINIGMLPKDPDFTDTVSGRHRLVVTDRYPEIYLTKMGNKWLYDPGSYGSIQQQHQQLYPLGSEWLINLVPNTGQRKFLGLYIWQYAGMLIFVIASFLVYWVAGFFFRMLLKKVLRRLRQDDLFQQYIRPVAKPFSWMLVVLLLLLLVPTLQLPINISKYVILGLKTLLPIFFILVFYYLADVLSLYLEKLAKRTESTMDDQLIPIVRRSAKIFVIAVGGLFILHNLDVNITTLLAGLSIGGLALALAAQDTLKNFLGSVMIFIDRPFQIGDWISADGIDGTVEEVGFRSTRVRNFSNSLVTVPNGRLSDLTIDNHGLRVFRRFRTHFGITYDTPTQLVETFVEGLKKIVQQHPDTRKDYYEIHLNELGDSSLNVLFYIFFQVPDWSQELKARHEILLEVIKWAEEIGVRFAFPTQTLHMETYPGQLPLTPTYDVSMEDLRLKLENYFDREREA